MACRLPALMLSLLLAPFAGAAPGPVTVVENVSGYTLDDGELRRFAGLSFADGVVLALHGTAAEAAAAHGDRRIDGAGATLLPGLIDAHGHVAGHGKALATVRLGGAGSEAEAAARVAAFAADNPGAGWIEGNGWNQVTWPGRAFPRRAALDSVVPDRPVALARVDGHALWVNSRALELAGIDADTEDPAGGQILRDDAGEPTGILIDNAMALVAAARPAEDLAATMAHLARGLADLAANGLTAVHDAGVTAQELAGYRRLLARGELPVRVYAMLSLRDPAVSAQLAAGPEQDSRGMLTVRSVKLYADGALGSRGAALLDPYSDEPENRGLLLREPAELEAQMRRAAAAGFQVNVHAIGDRANRLVLDAFGRLPDRALLRHRVEHAQILTLPDLERFAALDVIASVQPTHATSDKNMAADRLGEARLAGAYAWQSLLESGARVAFGSDFPVEDPNPFFGLHAAVTRQDREGEPPGGWRPAERLDRATALSLFTEGAAWAMHEEARLGRLLPGYAADFILVRDDPFAVPPGDLWRNAVLATWVDGRQVYSANSGE
ncbi:amidohydrolase [Pseudohaliea sp.]|uniref:amidohydrolase n=1 Tax=Pseudohaliea sp. TaxID=2740289 RepID=UPI0032EDC8FE